MKSNLLQKNSSKRNISWVKLMIWYWSSKSEIASALIMSVSGLFQYMARTLSTLFSMQQPLCNSTPYPSQSSWDVHQIISLQKRNLSNYYGVLILNRPLTQSSHFLCKFWNNASVRVAVDGGMNQWDQFIEKLPYDLQKTLVLPDLITGDFDSIPTHIHRKYKAQIIHTPDQNYTDFTKAIIELNGHCLKKKIKIEHIIAFGQSSGRLDHVLGNIQTLYLVKEKALVSRDIEIYLITDDAISWLLTPGQHVITIPKDTLQHKRAWCSLVPVGGTCSNVTTTGLKWNLKNDKLRFGDLVSTSNAFDGSKNVTINCTNTLLWSMRIPAVTGSLNLELKNV